MTFTSPHQLLPLLIALSSPFDSHAAERAFRIAYPELFAAEVGHYAFTPDPLHRFSMSFGRWLRDSFQDVIRKTQKVVSKNLRERPSRNQEWERIG